MSRWKKQVIQKKKKKPGENKINPPPPKKIFIIVIINDDVCFFSCDIKKIERNKSDEEKKECYESPKSFEIKKENIYIIIIVLLMLFVQY